LDDPPATTYQSYAVVFTDEDAAGELKMVEYYKWIQANKPGAPKR